MAQFTFPGSSYLSRATYDAATKTLTVEFKGGGVAEHTNVPQDVVDNLEAGGGSYYRQTLYGRYGAVSM